MDQREFSRENFLWLDSLLFQVSFVSKQGNISLLPNTFFTEDSKQMMAIYNHHAMPRQRHTNTHVHKRFLPDYRKPASNKSNSSKYGKMQVKMMI